MMKSRIGKFVHEWLVFFPALVLPITLGGVSPWFWSLTAAIFFLGMLFYLWIEGPGPLGDATSRKTWLAALCVLLAYPFLTIIPLPSSLLAVLSPHRLFWVQAGQQYAGASHIPATISYTPIQTLFGGAWWIFLACYGFFFRGLVRDDKEYNRFVTMLFCIAAAEALYGILQVLIPSMGVLWERGPSLGMEHGGCARGTFVNRNHFAAFMNLIWPVLLARLLTLGPGPRGKSRFHDHGSVSRQKKFFLGFLAFLVILSILFSQSRGGIMGLLIAFSLFMVLGGFLKKKMVLVFAGCWMVLLIYGGMIGYDAIISRFERATTDFQFRYNIWKDALDIIRDHPLTGIGLDSYNLAAPIYTQNLPDNIRSVHVHNDYLETIVELGIPVGSAIILFVWIYWWKRAIALWRSRSKLSPAIRLRTAGAVAGAGALLWHEWLDFNAEIPAVLLYALMIFILMGSSSGQEGFDKN